MKAVDFIKISKETMKLLSDYDIRMGDFKYINLYSDYEDIVSQGGKVSYAVAVLAGKYDISEASIYRILRRFRRTIEK